MRATDGGGLTVDDVFTVTVKVLLSLSSAANQSFKVGDPATPADTITITDDGVTPTIVQPLGSGDIRIRIPSTSNMTWNTAITAVSIGGGAAGNFSTTLLAYEDGGRTAVLNVTTAFAAGDQITVWGLEFTNFSAASSADNLELEVANDGAVSATDDRTIRVSAETFAVALTPTTTTASRLPSNGTNYTVDFTVVNNGDGSEDYDLLTTQNPGAAISVVSITGTGVTQGANPDSARVANVAASAAAVVTVTYSVADVAAGVTDTLVFTARSVDDPATTDDGRLELTVIKPNMTTVRGVSPGGIQLPGTDLTYTVTITNNGSDDAAGVVIAESLPVELDLQVGSVVNNLPTGVTASVEFSNDGGSTWTYTPVSAGCGAPTNYDACATHIRWTLQNNLSFIGPDNTGDVQFVGRIQ